MPNQQLIDYIKQATEQGQSREQIKAMLLGAGWQEGDIEMAFSPVGGTPVPQPPQVIASSFNNTQTASIGAPEVMYGGFWIRFLAFTLDNLIIFLLISVPIVIIAFGIFLTIGKQIQLSIWYVILIASLNILHIILRFAYFIVLTHKKQATLGKRLLGLKVISEGGSKLSLGRIIVRETIGKILSALILGIGYLMVAFTAKKQGLHDKFTSSIVVSNPAERKTWALAVAIIFATILPVAAILGIFAAITLASLDSARAKGSDAAVGANLSNIRASAEVVYDMNGGYGNMLSNLAVANSLSSAEVAARVKAVANVTDTAYAIYLPLRKPIPPATGWCVDSTGFSKPSVSPGVATSCISDQLSSRSLYVANKENITTSTVPVSAGKSNNENLVQKAIEKFNEKIKPNTVYTVARKKTEKGVVVEDYVYTIDISTNKVTTVKVTKGSASSALMAVRYHTLIKELEKRLASGELRLITPGEYEIMVVGAPFSTKTKIDKEGYVTDYDLYVDNIRAYASKLVGASADFARIVIRTTEYSDPSGTVGSIVEEVYTKK